MLLCECKGNLSQAKISYFKIELLGFQTNDYLITTGFVLLIDGEEYERGMEISEDNIEGNVT